MAVIAYPKNRRNQQPRKLPPAPPVQVWQPPSGALVNAILQYADIQQDIGGGQMLLRLSERRMKDRVISKLLGREASRLSDISVIWDERQGEIFRILDVTRGDDPALVDFHSDPANESIEDEEFEFELTPAALAYIAAHEAKKR